MNNPFENYFENNNNDITFNKTNIREIEKEPEQTVLENLIRKSDNNFKKLNSINILNDIPKNTILGSCITMKDIKPQFLEVKQLNILSDEIFESNIIPKYDLNTIKDLSNYILNLKMIIEHNTFSQSVGPLKEIDDLIEGSSNYNINLKDEILQKQEILKDILYYRRIKGDGNCFYRCIFVQLFENIIFNNKINTLKGIILEVCQCYNNKNNEKYLKINSKDNINYKLCIRILIAIYLKLKENKIEEAYKIFIYSMNKCQHFDLGFIWYFRYALFRYIQDNKGLFFSEDFEILIGNLLPEKFEINGEFLFNKFFEEYLLKVYSEAEKIIIYLTPYIFGINLIIYTFDCSTQIFTYKGKSNFDFENDITIIFRKAHYELIYPINYFIKYKTILEKYLDTEPYFSILNNRKINISKEKKNIENKQINSKSKSTLLKEKNVNNKCKECNTFSDFLNNPLNKTQLCLKCLQNLITKECLNQYISFITNHKPNMQYHLSDLKININGKIFLFDELFYVLQTVKEILQKGIFKYNIMTMVCINCKKVIDNKKDKIILPCESALCKSNCLNNIIKSKNNEFCCPLCQKKYKKEELIKLNSENP